MTWIFPIKNWQGQIPAENHPGAFGHQRKHDIHTGVDLYVQKPCAFYAVESGVVVAVENFTGPKAQSPWWLPTQAILIEGETGVVCYGEAKINNLSVGDKVAQSDRLGYISPVLPSGKERLDITGHSRLMLHFELYETGARETVWWHLDQPMPASLLDPTKFLLNAQQNLLNQFCE